MKRNNNKKQIIGITTDPYDNIYGYSLVFIRLFDYIQKHNEDFNVSLISNNGVSSALVNNKKFKKIILNYGANIFVKTFLLTFFFIKILWTKNNSTILVANSEIPELLAAFVLKIKFKKIYCMVHDLQVRDASLKTSIINKIRLFLIYRIKNVIFINRYTMNQLNGSINKFYIGCPIF